MTIEQIEKMNQQFQHRALGLSELMTNTDMMGFATLLKRSAEHIHRLFAKLVMAQSERAFWPAYEKMDEVINDLIYELDRLHDVNCVLRIKAVDTFVKSGYDLLSIYSISSDQVLKQFMKTQNIRS